MQQAYHSNARTNLNIRLQLQNNSSTNSELASRFDISQQTVSKWKNRDFIQDSSCSPLNIQYALSDLEKALAISLRTSSWVSIDEVWESLLEINSKNIPKFCLSLFCQRKNQSNTSRKER